MRSLSPNLSPMLIMLSDAVRCHGRCLWSLNLIRALPRTRFWNQWSRGDMVEPG